MVTYEETLDRDLAHAMNEGSRYFEGRGAVQDALRKITARLRALGIDYAVAGGMALFVHGLRRFTEDVDILVSGENLRTIHRELEGLGYTLPFAGSKNLRDAASGVRIEFLVTGQYPGDGKPKPVAFPRPADVSLEREGIRYLNLPTLIQLKLASGMTNAGRVKDLVDVQELVKLLLLPSDFADQLNPYVRAKYQELWSATRQQPRRYLRLWRGQPPQGSPALAAMLAAGITLEPDPANPNDAYLVTSDRAAAARHDLHDEDEFWNGG